MRTELRLRALAVEAEAGVLSVLAGGLHPLVNVFRKVEVRLGSSAALPSVTAGIRVE